MGNSKTKSTAIKSVDAHLPAVVKLIRDKCPELVPGTRALLNMSHKPVAINVKGLTFGAGTAAPYLVEMQAGTAQWVMDRGPNVRPEARMVGRWLPKRGARRW